MFNLKTYFLFLSRNKLYSFVNVFGLSTSLMFVILISNYAFSEFTADSFHENVDQIYVLSDEDYVGTAYRIGEKLQNRYPEIEKVCGVISAFDKTPVKVLSNNISVSSIAVDSTFMSMFSFKLLRGDRNEVLKTQHDILVSEAFARKTFGNNDPIGNTIVLTDSIIYTINGVIQDFENSVFKPTDIVMRIENMEYLNQSAIDEGMGNAGSTYMFIQTQNGSDIRVREKEIAEYFKTFFWPYKNGLSNKIFFIPMRDLYFDERSEPMYWNVNNKMTLAILVFVSLLILVFAVINYVNLTVAQTGFRAKEMATRRLYGASKKKVFGKMIFESTFLCFVAFLIGYFLAFLMEPYASGLINKDIMLAENMSVDMILFSVVFVIFIGVVSGLIPAIAISRFQPLDVVKGTYTFKSKMTFSKVFITIQSVITIILIACSLTIYRQVEYMISYDYGYKTNAIIDVESWHIDAEAFRDKLKSVPSVKSIGFTRGTPLDRGNNNTIKVDNIDKSISFQMLISDSATVKMLDIEFVKDNVLAEDGYWINQSALDELGATDDIKSFRHKWGEVKIAGVIKEFAMGDLVSSGGGGTPLLFQVNDNLKEPWSVLVEIEGDLVKGFRDVKRAFEDISEGVEFTGRYIDAQIEESYAEQRRMQMIMIVFSIIAIIISSLGLLAISSYFVQQRSREIAVRKIFGSTRLEMLLMVTWRFMQLVIVAFFIASPIVWYMMDMWLVDFPHRISLDIWIFLVAGVFNLLIAFLMVYLQSSQVVNANPIKSLMR